jgi:hypothetical protein
MMQKSRTITLQFGAESSQWSAEREFFSSGLRLLQHTYWNWKLFVCFSRATSERKVAPPSRVVCFGREAYIPKVYELVELNTKRACVRAASKKTTACTWEKATRLRVRKINGTLTRKYIILTQAMHFDCTKLSSLRPAFYAVYKTSPIWASITNKERA